MKKSFHFVFNKPIVKTKVDIGNTLFLFLEGVKDSAQVELVECNWSIFQGDSFIAGNKTEPEITNDFLPELISLKVEEVTYSASNKHWLFQLSDGTQLFADFTDNFQKCVIVFGVKTYNLWSDGEITITEKSKGI